MAEDPVNSNQEENRSRALDKVREYPLAPSTYYPEPEDEVHLRDYLQIILRRKWIVITFFVAVVTTVTLGTYMMKPQFRATTTLKIDKENNQILLFKDSYSVENVDEKYYQTQYK